MEIKQRLTCIDDSVASPLRLKVRSNTFGELLAYRCLYEALTAAYPELARAESPDVIHVRHMMTREERLERERRDAERENSPYAGMVKSAIYEVLGRDDFPIRMDKPLLSLNLSAPDVVEVARVLEKRCWDGKKHFVIPNFDFGCRLTPQYFADTLEGRYVESVKTRMGLLKRYASAAERDAAEAEESPGLHALRCAIREYLEDPLVVIEPEMRFYDELHFNYDDLSETTRFAEAYLGGIRLEATRRESPRRSRRRTSPRRSQGSSPSSSRPCSGPSSARRSFKSC